MSTSCDSTGRPPASVTKAFFNSKPGASLASSEPDSAMVSRGRANADGFAAVTIGRLTPAAAAGFASAGFAATGFATAGAVGFAATGFAAAGAAGGAANETAAHVPRKT